VKQNPPFHQKPTGGSPLLEKAKKKKEKPLTSPELCVRFLSQREKPAVLWIAFWLCQVRVFVLKNTLACLAV
jgi:hypothetical protein